MTVNAPRYPLATVGALVVGPSGRVLLTRTHKWRHRWSVPGGKIAYGESMRSALLREVREETRLELTDVHWGPVQEAVQSEAFYRSAHFILLNFIARSPSEVVTLNEEAQAFVWVAPEEALGYDLNPPTKYLVDFYLEHGFSTGVLA